MNPDDKPGPESKEILHEACIDPDEKPGPEEGVLSL